MSNMLKRTLTASLFSALILGVLVAPDTAAAAPVTSSAALTFSSVDSQPSRTAELKGYRYFAADDGTNGTELWRSNGTAAGTQLFGDLTPGTNPRHTTFSGRFITTANHLYFVANGALYRTNGSAAPVKLTLPFTIDNRDSLVHGTIGDTVLLNHRRGGSTWDLYALKDNSTAPQLLRTFSSLSSEPGALLNGNWYFAAAHANGATGSELWRTNGTSAGTTLVADIRSGTHGSQPIDFFAASDRVYFVANDGPSHELWVTRGTSANTVKLTTASGNDGTPTSSADIWVSRLSASTRGTDLFYVSHDGPSGSGQTIWRTGGTRASTRLMSDLPSFPTLLPTVGSRIMFLHNPGKLGASDGTAKGTALIKPVNSSPIPGAGYTFERGGRLYYFTVRTLSGRGVNELWRTNGTNAVNSRLAELGGAPAFAAPAGNRIVFIARPKTGGALRAHFFNAGAYADLTAPTPKITGTKKAGKTLRALTAGWTAGTRFSYQWFRGGDAIPGAKKSTYRVKARDGGTRISVRVTGTKTGHLSTSRTSASVTIAYTRLKTSKPRISGSATVGRTLTVKTGKWTNGTNFRYQWLRNGKAIPGAKGKKLVLNFADNGSRISVSVTGNKTGHRNATKISKQTAKVKRA